MEHLIRVRGTHTVYYDRLALSEARMHARTSTKEREARIAELEAEVAELQKEIGNEEDAQQIVSRHIKLLHRYNEAKDATQIIIGKLAVHKQTTIRQTHEDYGLTDDD